MFIVTIDSGTTNTRVRIWQEQQVQVIAEASEPVGLRDAAITGDNEPLAASVKRALDTVLTAVPECSADRCVIVASGMITADIGLCPLPHLPAPVALQDLAQAMLCRVLPAISHRPIWFIPGIKNAVAEVTVDNLDAMDVMRGEEVEAWGLIAQMNIRGPALIVLPGSHSKFIRLDQHQRIVSSCTTLSGELLDVLTHQTLLATSLSHQFASEADKPFLLKGAASCRDVGLTRSCFAVRLLDLFTPATHNQKASYLLGVMLQSDLQAIRHSRALNLMPDLPIFISGNPLVSQALATLIAADPFFTARVVVFSEDRLCPLSGLGAIAVLKTRADQMGTSAAFH